MVSGYCRVDLLDSNTWIDINSELVMETPANVFKPEPLGLNIFEPFLEL